MGNLGMLARVLLALAVVFWSGTVVAQQAPDGRLTVIGTGEVARAPDMAVVRLAVTAEDDSAAGALDAASERASAVLAALEAVGVDARDVQTTGLSLNPVWEEDAGAPRGGRRIAGYVARNGLTVRVRDLDGLGALLDRVVAEGADSLEGLEFALQNPEAAADAARRAAVRAAQRKAVLYAEAAGVNLGPVLRLAEAGNDDGGPGPTGMREMAMAAVPVAAGELSVTATVEMEFALLP